MAAEGPGFGASVPYHVWAAGSVPYGETMWLECCSWSCGHWGETFFSSKLARVGPILLVLSSRGGKETSVRGAGRSCPREKLLEALLLLIPAGWELTSVQGLCGTGAGQEVHGDQGEETVWAGSTWSGQGGPRFPTDFSLGLTPTLPISSFLRPPVLLLSPTPFLEMKSSRKIIKK